jgi:iron(III) transport system permease protein
MSLSIGRYEGAAGRQHNPLNWALVAMAALVLLPLLSLVVSSLDPSGGSAFPLPQLTQAALETAILCAAVLCVAMGIGVATGWLVAMHEFPGRGAVSWLLVLPFAIPGYIAAYALVDFFDFFGPVQSGLRHMMGWTNRADYWFPDLRSRSGAVLVHALTLYPYIYLASRTAFSQQTASIHDAARLLGCRRIEAAWRVLIPSIWPALAAGGTMVLLETLNDIGANQYLGVNTLSVAVFNTWQSKNDFAGAASIALATLVTVIGLIWIEQQLRRPDRFKASARGGSKLVRHRLTAGKAFVALSICLLPVLIGFFAPVSTLLTAAWRQLRRDGLPADFLQITSDTIMVSGLAALMLVAISLLGSFALRERHGRFLAGAAKISTLGYAIPGTVLVIGALPVIGGFDQMISRASVFLTGERTGALLSGSMAAIVLTYLIRFHAIGIEQTRAGLDLVSRNIDHAGRLLGAGRIEVARSILLPAIRPSLFAAAILIFVDCLKELPATLLLRPLNFETFATSLYGHASRGSFEDGALAALAIILCGLVALLAVNPLLERERARSTIRSSG